MDYLSFDDKLEILGVLAGGFVILAALGTLLGQPWSTAEGTVVGLVQVLGILLTIGVGVLVILVTQGKDIDRILPF